MTGRSRLTAALVLGAALVGCSGFQVTNLLNEDFLSALGFGEQVATLPGDAPGLLVSVENMTDRFIAMAVSYRDINDNVQSYSTTIASGDKSSRLLGCPVQEITIGDISNLNLSGARVYLVNDLSDPNAASAAPYIEVEPFGVLLKSTVNYDCGDGLILTVQPSTLTSSGYQTIAYIRRSGS